MQIKLPFIKFYAVNNTARFIFTVCQIANKWNAVRLPGRMREVFVNISLRLFVQLSHRLSHMPLSGNTAALMFQNYWRSAKKHADKTKNGSLNTLVLRSGKVELFV